MPRDLGARGIRLALPYVELQEGKPHAVYASVSYVTRADLSPEQSLKISLAGPIAEESFCPNCRTRSEMKGIRDNDLKAGRKDYLECGGSESNFEDDLERWEAVRLPRMSSILFGINWR